MSHEEVIKELFWKRLKNRAPTTNKACRVVEQLFNDVWKDISSDIIGKDAEITVLIEDNTLRGTYGGWLLMGLIAVAGINVGLLEIDETKSKALKQLNDRLDELDKKLKTVNNNVRDIRKNIQDLREKYEKPPY